jgi:hypothetical protein
VAGGKIIEVPLQISSPFTVLSYVVHYLVKFINNVL